jgi:hypothetical protein
LAREGGQGDRFGNNIYECSEELFKEKVKRFDDS